MTRSARSRLTGLGALFVGAAMVLAGASVAFAQPPAVGTPVDIATADGVVHASLTVDSFETPFTDVAEGATPPEGYQWASLVVTVAAAGDQVFSIQPYQLQLRATDGRIITPTRVYRDEEPAIPDLEPQDLAAGSTVQGFVGFAVPTDAVIADVLYVPGTYVALPIASITPNVPPAQGSEVPVVVSDGGQASVTVAVHDPFTDYQPGYEPEPGQRWVAVDVVMSNTGDRIFTLSNNQFYLRDDQGNLYYGSYVGRPEGFTLPPMEGQPLAPGDRISGFLAFQVPSGAPIEAVEFWPESGRRVEIASMGGAQPSGTTAPAGSPVVATRAPVTPAPEESVAPSAAPASVAPASMGPQPSAGVSQ